MIIPHTFVIIFSIYQKPRICNIFLYFFYSQEKETIKDEASKESIEENVTANQNLGRGDEIAQNDLKSYENVRTPEFKWKSEIHSRND